MDTTSLILLAEARDAAASGRGRRLREVAGLSQREVADSIGVRQPTLQRWERGLRAPRGEPAVKWARLLRAMAGHVAGEEVSAV